MIAVPAAVAPLLAQQSKRLSTCWKLTRTDGVTFRFTNHDRILTVEGLTPNGVLP